MIIGTHVIVYTKDAEGTRAFFRDTLGFPHVDAGEGWLIFRLPPAEMGVHPEMEGQPGGEAGRHELYLMCDDVRRTVADLERKGVVFTSPITDQGYGLVTAFRLPDGSEMGLYEPRHPMAIPSPRTGKARAKPRKAAGRRRPAAKRKRKARRG